MPEKLAKIWWFLAFFLLGGAGVLYILPSVTLRIIFAVVMFAAVVWVWRKGANVDINSLSLITAFTLTVAQFGLHFYFSLSGWLVLLLSFIWIGLLFWLGFQIVTGRRSGSLNVLSLTAALIGAQIALALVFWPVHFLVASTIFFLFYYLVWMITYFYLNGLLNRNRVIIHAAFVVVVLAAVLLTAKWNL